MLQIRGNIIMFYILIGKFSLTYYTFGSICCMSPLFTPITILQDTKWKHNLMLLFLV